MPSQSTNHLSSESVNSLGMTELCDANSFSEINSRILPLTEFCTPNKRQCFSQDGSLFKPVCDEALKPTVGMRFDDIASVEAFYKNYAHQVGFGVRLGPQRMVNNVIHWKRFLCAREGYRSMKGHTLNISTQTQQHMLRLTSGSSLSNSIPCSSYGNKFWYKSVICAWPQGVI